MYIKLTTHTTEYRIQNAEYRMQNKEHRTQNTEHRTQNKEQITQNTEHGTKKQNKETHVHKTTYGPLIDTALFVVLLMRANPYLGKWEGVGPWKSQLFWAPNGTRLVT
jgi:hypothetical protein